MQSGDNIEGCIFCLIIWLVIAYYESRKKDKVKAVQQRPIEYMVNDKKIPCAFDRFYFERLHIPYPDKPIEFTTIARHHAMRVAGDKLDADILCEVDAAALFFRDRFNYMSYLN